MNRTRPSQRVFAAAMVALGLVGLAFGDASLVWADIPKSVPGRGLVIDACSVVLVACGAGLTIRRFMAPASAMLWAFTLLWLIVLKLPPLLRAPQAVVSWESFAEIAVTAAGAWCLFAVHAGARERSRAGFAAGPSGLRAARLLYIAALPMIGLSHFVYRDLTASLVPKWMHFALGWTYLTGAASIVAAAAMLLRIRPRLAASLEAAMLWIITLLVWVPRAASAPAEQANWSELLISCAIAGGAWLVADSYLNSSRSPAP